MFIKNNEGACKRNNKEQYSSKTCTINVIKCKVMTCNILKVSTLEEHKHKYNEYRKVDITEKIIEWMIMYT